MKKILLALLIITSTINAQYTFLVKKYSKEIELEAKIIANISKALTNTNAKIFIPKLKKENYSIYSNYIKLVNNCSDADIIYIKNSIKKLEECKQEKKIFFTNNYRILIKEPKFVGAFFWSKSRPNIVFINNRLKRNKIILPKDYNQFIEEGLE